MPQHSSLKAIHCLNTFTCSPYIPAGVRVGTLSLLLETIDGLILIDTGPGLADCSHKACMHHIFEFVTKADIKTEETAIRQIEALGFDPADVGDIILTHMHFDHCGGIPDFPHARVHVHRREFNAFSGRRTHWLEAAYLRRHGAHQPRLHLYDDGNGSWFGFPAIRLQVMPEMYLIPLNGHTRGHCGVAFRTDAGWWFHLGDAAPLQFEHLFPAWLERLILGDHLPRLYAFRAQHPEMQWTTGHMRLDFFEAASSR